MDIGIDVGPVDITYKPPFPFTGKIDKVTIDLSAPDGTIGRK
jgi:arylsulfatase